MYIWAASSHVGRLLFCVIISFIVLFIGSGFRVQGSGFPPAYDDADDFTD